MVLEEKKMRKIRVYPYKQGSRSAKALAQSLGGVVLKHVGSRYRPRRGDVIINWGAGDPPKFMNAVLLNPDIKAAANKLLSFRALSGAGVRVPVFWENRADVPHDHWPIVCRTKLTGHSGEGIVIANTVEELVQAPLYTKYVKKKDEYRIHVIGARAFFAQRKARRLEEENPNWQIRNLAGGFVFVEVALQDVPADVLDQAVASVAALGLDFGGVDVMWNEREQKAYVLEVNTACGLEDRTARYYRDAILHYLQN